MAKKGKVLSNDGPLSNRKKAAAGGEPGPTPVKEKHKGRRRVKRKAMTYARARKEHFGL